MTDINTIKEVNENGQVEILSLYELNKQGYNTAKPYNAVQISKSLQDIFTWICEKPHQYYMLLSNERRDYTVFNILNANVYDTVFGEKSIITLLKSRGQILDIKKDESMNAFEIWLRIGKESFGYYLFDCDDFIIEVK